jgi:hypothetical protein
MLTQLLRDAGGPETLCLRRGLRPLLRRPWRPRPVRFHDRDGALRGRELDLLHSFAPIEPITRSFEPTKAVPLANWLIYHEAFLLEQVLGPHALLAMQPGLLRIAHIESIMNVFDTHARIVDDYAIYIRSDIFSGCTLCKHQVEAIKPGMADEDFVVTSDTGSGKPLTYIGSIFHGHLSRRAPQASREAAVGAGTRGSSATPGADLRDIGARVGPDSRLEAMPKSRSGSRSGSRSELMQSQLRVARSTPSPRHPAPSRHQAGTKSTSRGTAWARASLPTWRPSRHARTAQTESFAPIPLLGECCRSPRKGEFDGHSSEPLDARRCGADRLRRTDTLRQATQESL